MPRIFLPGRSTIAPVTDAPLAITTPSPTLRSCAAVKRSGCPSSVLSGIASERTMLKGVPSSRDTVAAPALEAGGATGACVVCGEAACAGGDCGVDCGAACCGTGCGEPDGCPGTCGVG